MDSLRTIACKTILVTGVLMLWSGCSDSSAGAPATSGSGGSGGTTNSTANSGAGGAGGSGGGGGEGAGNAVTNGFEWVWQSSGESGEHYALDAVTDVAGSLYLLGHYRNELDFGPVILTNDGISSTPFLAKFSSEGAVLWARVLGEDQLGQVGGIDQSSGHGMHLLLDPEGNVVTLTHLENRASYVRKVTSDGEDVWALEMGSLGIVQANGIAADAAGNLYVGGFYGPYNSSLDVTTMTFGDLTLEHYSNTECGFIGKIDAMGNAVTVKQYCNPDPNLTDAGIRWERLAIEPSGELVLTGEYGGSYDSPQPPLCNNTAICLARVDAALNIVGAAPAYFLSGDGFGLGPDGPSWLMGANDVGRFDASLSAIWTRSLSALADDSVLVANGYWAGYWAPVQLAVSASGRGAIGGSVSPNGKGIAEDEGLPLDCPGGGWGTGGKFGPPVALILDPSGATLWSACLASKGTVGAVAFDVDEAIFVAVTAQPFDHQSFVDFGGGQIPVPAIETTNHENPPGTPWNPLFVAKLRPLSVD